MCRWIREVVITCPGELFPSIWSATLLPKLLRRLPKLESISFERVETRRPLWLEFFSDDLVQTIPACCATVQSVAFKDCKVDAMWVSRFLSLLPDLRSVTLASYNFTHFASSVRQDFRVPKLTSLRVSGDQLATENLCRYMKGHTLHSAEILETNPYMNTFLYNMLPIIGPSVRSLTISFLVSSWVPRKSDHESTFYAFCTLKESFSYL